MREHSANSGKTVISVAIVTALCLTGDSMLYVTLPLYWKSAGLSAIWEVGVLLSVNRFVRLPLNPLIGWIYQKISLRTGLFLAILLSVLTTCGYGMARSFIVWVLLRCLWGAAWSLLRIGGLSAVVLHSDSRNRGRSIGTYNGLYRLGSLLGMLLGGVLTPIVGFHAIAIGMGIISLAGLPFIYRSVEADSVHSRQGDGINKGFRLQKITSGVLIVVASGFMVTMLFEGLFRSTLSYAIESQYGHSFLLFGLILQASAVSGVIQAARWGWEPFLSSRIGHWSDGPKGRRPLYVFSLLCACVLFLLIPWHMPAAVWLFIVLLSMLSATALTTLTDSLASDAAQASSVVSFLTVYTIAQDLGAAVGPLVGYLFLPLRNGYAGMFFGGAAVFLAMALVWWFSQPYAKQPQYQNG